MRLRKANKPICPCGGRTVCFIRGVRCCGRCKQPLRRVAVYQRDGHGWVDFWSLAVLCTQFSI